jgi:hypothetical protein
MANHPIVLLGLKDLFPARLTREEAFPRLYNGVNRPMFSALIWLGPDHDMKVIRHYHSNEEIKNPILSPLPKDLH